jgi:hypothetical protein
MLEIMGAFMSILVAELAPEWRCRDKRDIDNSMIGRLLVPANLLLSMTVWRFLVAIFA